MARLFTNNASSTLASGIVPGDTTIALATGTGSRFPALAVPDHFIITLTQAGTETSWEEVKVIARSGDTLTVVRGQEGSTASSWSTGDKVEMRWTADSASNAANVAVSGVTTIDFGPAPGSYYATTTVAGQDDISANSQADAWIMGASSEDHNEIEHLIVPMTLRTGNILPGVSFEIVATSELRLTGKWAIQWARTL